MQRGRERKKKRKESKMLLCHDSFVLLYIHSAGIFPARNVFQALVVFYGNDIYWQEQCGTGFFLLFPENTFFSSLLLYLAHQGLPPRGKKARLLYVRSRKGSRFCLLPVLSSQYWRWKLGFAGPLTCMSKEKKERLRHAND